MSDYPEVGWDKLTLGGQDLLVRNPVVMQPATEFVAGVKIGRAQYDERTGAFYLVIDDFSGGIGFDIADLREELGVYWRSTGVDGRRSRHLTLPPRNQTHNSHQETVANDKPVTRGVLSSPISNKLHVIAGNTLFHSDDGVNFTASTLTGATANIGIRGISEVKDGTTWKIAIWFPFDNGGNRRLWASSDGVTYTALGSNPDFYIGDVFWHGDAAWILTTSRSGEGGTPHDNRGKIFYTENFTTYTERYVLKGQPIDGRWVGVYPDVNGRPAIYLTAGGDLYAFDPNGIDVDPDPEAEDLVFNATPVALGAGVRVSTGEIWQGGVVVTDGQSVLHYQVSSSGETLRELGLVRFRNMPDELQGGRIVKLEGGPDVLWALYETANAQDHMILGWNGTGWHIFYGGGQGNIPTRAFGIGFTPIQEEVNKRGLYYVTRDALAENFEIESIHLPTRGEVPVRGLDEFDPGPRSLFTPLINGGFAELQGTLLELSVDGHFTPTETMDVYYSIDEGPFVFLGTFTEAGQSIQFGGGQGEQFRVVRFRLDFVRGASLNETPDLHALILKYQKKPELRMQYQFHVDVNKMMQEGKPRIGQENLEPTFLNVYNFLRDMWNSHELIPLTVPGLGKDVYVELVAMPLTLQEVIEGQLRGLITVQVVEPLPNG